MNLRRFILAIILVFATLAPAQADLAGYVGDLNIYASRQFDNFRLELSARYGMSPDRFDSLLGKVDSPGDLAVSLWVGFQAVQPVEAVIKQYRLRRGQGWGVIAKQVGIKPGSKAFKALQSGELGWFPKDFDVVMKRRQENRSAAGAGPMTREEREQRALEKKELKRQQRKEKDK